MQNIVIIGSLRHKIYKQNKCTQDFTFTLYLPFYALQHFEIYYIHIFFTQQASDCKVHNVLAHSDLLSHIQQIVITLVESQYFQFPVVNVLLDNIKHLLLITENFVLMRRPADING
jgi:hypothetical protein